MPDLGGKVIDTAPAYGRSEVVVGELLADLGNRDRYFLATKVTAPDGDLAKGRAMLEESFRRLRTPRIDLVQVHNLDGVDVLMPVLREAKDAKRIRYIGVTTSRAEQYPRMLEVMRRHALDFIQVDYSIDNRAAAEEVLPLAQERGVAVLINMPFGGRRTGNLFPKLAGREVPRWAVDAGAASWAQFLLRYVISHPAVTCAIPGTHRVGHLEDNMRAGRSELPDRAMRTRMEEYWATAGFGVGLVARKSVPVLYFRVDSFSQAEGGIASKNIWIWCSRVLRSAQLSCSRSRSTFSSSVGSCSSPCVRGGGGGVLPRFSASSSSIW